MLSVLEKKTPKNGHRLSLPQPPGHSPPILHRLDVEAEGGADGGDVLPIQALDNRGLARIVKPPVELQQTHICH